MLINYFFIGDYICYTLYSTVTILMPLLIAIAFFTLAERKIIAAIQRRRGPNVIGYWGVFQPFADGLKLFIKEVIVPYQSARFLFLLAPLISFVLSLFLWSLIPVTYNDIFADNDYGLLYVYALSSLSVYGIILAGWASFSKYPFLGALRSAAQIISYEVCIGLIFTTFTLVVHSLNLIDIVHYQSRLGWLIIPLFVFAFIFFVSIIAETNRAPFDLPEAEAEIVAGYNLEYSSILFAFFFLGEYSNIILISALYTILFLGGWLCPGFIECFTSTIFFIKILFICFLFILIRATLPRYRYDQLIDICWQLFLPVALIYLLAVVSYFLWCSSTFILPSSVIFLSTLELNNASIPMDWYSALLQQYGYQLLQSVLFDIIRCGKFLWDDSTFSYIMYQSDLPANIVNAAKVAYQSIPYCIPEPWFWQMVHDYYIRTGDVPLVDIIECGKFLWGDSRFSYIMYQGDLPANIVSTAKEAYQSIAYCTPEPWFWQLVHDCFIHTKDVPVVDIVKTALFLFDPVYTAKMITLNDPTIIEIYHKIYLLFKEYNIDVEQLHILLDTYFSQLKNTVPLDWFWNLVEQDIITGKCQTCVNVDKAYKAQDIIDTARVLYNM